jgi:hypothetical protein
MKFTLGSLNPKAIKAAMPKPRAMPHTAPLGKIAHGGASTLHLKRLALSKVRVNGGY